MATKKPALTTADLNKEYFDRLTTGPPFTNKEEMKYAIARMMSFSTWAVSHVKPLSLSEAGFYFSGEGTSVVCHSCDGILSDWQPGHDPWQRHIEELPGCKLVLERIAAGRTQTKQGDLAHGDGRNKTERQVQRVSHAQVEGRYQPGDGRNAEGIHVSENAATAGDAKASDGGEETVVPATVPARSSPAMMPRLLAGQGDPGSCGSNSSQPGDLPVAGSGCSNIPSEANPYNHPELDDNGAIHHSRVETSPPERSSPEAVTPAASAPSEEAAMSHWASGLTPVQGDVNGAHLRAEKYRLRTFISSWPAGHPMSPRLLAKDGFYYLGQNGEDEVQCFCCKQKIAGWTEAGLVVSKVHARVFPECAFVRGLDVGNLEYDVSPSKQEALVSTTTDKQAQHIEFANKKSRLATFADWPLMSPDKESLALAGFYYTGDCDRVKCFFCNGGLQSFDHGDNPWQLHCQWFPNCGYICMAAPGRTKTDFSKHQEWSQTYIETPAAREALDKGHPQADVLQAVHNAISANANRFPKNAKSLMTYLTTSADREGNHDNLVPTADPGRSTGAGPGTSEAERGQDVGDDQVVTSAQAPTSQVRSDSPNITQLSKQGMSRRQRKNRARAKGKSEVNQGCKQIPGNDHVEQYAGFREEASGFCYAL